MKRRAYILAFLYALAIGVAATDCYADATKSIGFHKQADHVSIASPTDTPNGTTMSVCAWAKYAGNSDGYLIGDGDGGDLRTNAGRLELSIFNGSESKVLSSPLTYDDVAWHFVCGVRNGTALMLYVDGSSVDTDTFAANTARAYRISSIGRRSVSQGHYKGLVRGVRLFSTAISAGDVTTLYNSGLFVEGTGAETALVAGYNLTENTGSTVADFSGNNKTGTINNPNSVYSMWFDGNRTAPATFFVKPTGVLTLNGSSIANAWPLPYALSHPPGIIPGDTIKVVDDSTFNGPLLSYLTGSNAAHITFRAETLGKYPSPIRLDGAPATGVNQVLAIFGRYTDYYDVKAFNSNPDRVSAQSGSEPSDIDVVQGIKVFGANITLINPVTMNNSSNGLVCFTPTGNVRVVNLITYGNGWTGTDRTHGHGMYTHNDTPAQTVEFKDTVTMSPYHFAVQQFSSESNFDSYNISWNGIVATNGTIAIVGNGPKHNFAINNARAYKGAIALGSADEPNVDVVFDEFTIAGQDGPLIATWTDLTVTNGRIAQLASTEGILFSVNLASGLTLSDYTIDDNVYYRGRLGGILGNNPYFIERDAVGANPVARTFSQWQAQGIEAGSSYNDQANQSAATRPAENWITYRQHESMPGRGLVVVYNWLLSSTVSVDLSQLGLANGQTYKIYNLQNPEVVFASGTYSGGSLSLSTASNGVLALTNDAGLTPAANLPEFGAFLVVPDQQGTVLRYYTSSAPPIAG